MIFAVFHIEELTCNHSSIICVQEFDLKLTWEQVNPVLYSQNMETYAVKIHKTEPKRCPLG